LQGKTPNMKCKPIILAIITVICGMNQAATQIGLSKETVDSIWSYNYNLGTELKNISYYNQIILSENLTDTIIVKMIDGEIIYNYKNHEFRNLRINHNNESPIQMQYSGSRHLNYLYAIVQKNEVEQLRLLVSKSDSCETKIRIENYKNSVLNEDYIEKCSSGEIYNAGKYYQMDSIYQDTIAYIDYVTYEEIVEIEVRNKFPIKCGTWITQTEEGIKTIEFKPCK
jgi:hypothetical protein